MLAAGYYFLISWMLSDVNVQPKKSMEESLVDTANILAAYLEQGIVDGKIYVSELGLIFNRVQKRKFSAGIYELTKKRINLDAYVTDKNGIVLFDSDGGNNEGEDFSGWLDIKRTLRGTYGARTTRLDPEDPASSVAYVAAPVYWHGDIIGACTVAKPWKSIHSFIVTSRNKIIITAILGFFLILVLSFFISYWITRPILKLTNYARSIKEGERTEHPNLGKNEIQVLGEAFEEMCESLEGKKYIEKYVQTLTHQLKGPLSSIYGAAELLQEDLEPADRDKFVNNISREAARIRRIVDRLLELAAIEQRKSLQKIERINFQEIVEEIVESLSLSLKNKNITCTTIINKSFFFRGEKFLMKQAIFNLLQNAVEFTPEGGDIDVTVSRDEKTRTYHLAIEDTGAGIPKYALRRIYDRFYSLPRPGTEQKSSGLGLFLVREVAQLHGGSVSMFNNPGKGATAILHLPM
jgi:two-component system sensor histidine kinase CreC